MEPVTLTTDRLLLRPPTPRDTETVLAAVQDPDILRWTTIPSPYLVEHAQSFTEQLAPAGWANDTMFTWGLFLPEGEDLVGMLGLTMRSPGTAEIGYWATKEHRGNGYVTEAVRAASRWAFTELSIDRVEWRAEVGNQPSLAVAERAGFVVEGVLRSGIAHQDVRRDCWVGALLPSDLGLPSTLQYLPAAP
ncbi:MULTISPECIES: GNAT family N-acetyltransferase [Streptomyces]|uniref:Acetyltransferase n=1 Tax=Streptomyces sviceus (strain ATCC 29083 / DSM 924 / JCM 4929 / NBRC 13980 / NCIMB 11184 / NRRL 5439 / UC 5370) TaxID=463191 RepID=B5I828_STRX2|nr:MULTISPECIES: GNAT family N-acetyltransferase [Streptomyces]EDY61233.1 acetyltransferase [Streptomyces sviceus ATCC 29083]MYT06225.1 GNAT family N-acetyltransferase [Streptomyces sp. SID5470]